MGKQPGTSVMGQGGAQGHWQGFLLLSCSTLLPQTAPKGPGTSTFFLLSLPGAVSTAWGGARAQGWADSGHLHMDVPQQFILDVSPSELTIFLLKPWPWSFLQLFSCFSYPTTH